MATKLFNRKMTSQGLEVYGSSTGHSTTSRKIESGVGDLTVGSSSRRRPVIYYSIWVVSILMIFSSFLANAQTITIGSGSLTSGTSDNGNPIYRSSAASSFGWSLSGHLYTASQLSSLPPGSTINSIAFNKVSTNGTASGRTGTLKVYMRNSSATTIPNTTTLGTVQAYTQVVNNSAAVIPTTAGYLTWAITPFVYTGGSLEIYVDWSTNGASSGLSTGAFTWLYGSGATSQTVGNSNSVAFTGSSTFASTQSRTYNLQINYTPPPACSGTPAPGNTIASASTVCSGSNVNLSLQNPTTGLGVTYQWHSSFDGTSYSPISGATSATLTANITTPQYFYCAVTCSGSTQNSGPVSVALNSFYNCYCSAIPSSTADEEIVNVSIGSLNNSSTCTTLAPGPGSTVARYSNYVSGSGSPAAPIIYTGSLTSGTVTISSCGTSNYTSGLAIFVDLNRDGDYTDAGEKVYTSGSTSNINCVPATVKQISFTIPSTTTSGLTTMRIINAESNSGDAITSCFAYGWGETEDYLIDLCSSTLLGNT